MTRVRRGVARWPLAIVALVVLLGLGWLGWTWLGGVLERRATAEAAGCPSGEVSLRVAVTPSVADPVRDGAQRWTDQHPVVNDHCVRVEVQSVDSKTILTGLTQSWDESKLGPKPVAWLPDSTLWANRLSAQNTALVGAAGQSVASSPVVLATQSPAYDALTTGNLLRWTDLPELTADPAGWARFGKPQWGKFRIAVPDPAYSPASAMAIQSALAGATGQGLGPVTTDMLAQQPVKDLIGKLAAARAANAPASAQDALDGLSRAGDIATASYSAVPITEVDLYRRNLGRDGAPAPGTPLYEVPVGGASPQADFPFVTLAGNWVNTVQGKAAQQFREFLRQPAQQKLFAAAGLRVDATSDRPKQAPGMRWPATTQRLVPADATTTQQISAGWAAAASGDLISVLVDGSAAMGQDGGDGRTRLDWVRDALVGQVDRSVAGASLGLWQYSANLDGDKPYRQLSPVVQTDQHADQLHSALGKLGTGQGAQLYSSVLGVYQSVLANYQAGKHNRIVVIVGSANEGGTDLAQLRSQLGQLRDAKRPVPISFIALGDGPQRDQLAGIAQDAGGTVSAVQNAKDVAAALGQLLSVAS
ncbi:hypothetical protein BC739_005551 [Kutzneria viridogrisea]|uniref:VWFA domain-containing protein n=1 Tax=Kutzneria viridogrisea TaxID=47990 RepID=A0ABR6BN62_9PSEU|nr:substrate-binding domain-containing protein [Kutzneria albida]MBA8928334.1 hypothetical protein [Kutzneria viridogrisea]